MHVPGRKCTCHVRSKEKKKEKRVSVCLMTKEGKELGLKECILKKEWLANLCTYLS